MKKNFINFTNFKSIYSYFGFCINVTQFIGGCIVLTLKKNLIFAVSFCFLTFGSTSVCNALPGNLQNGDSAYEHSIKSEYLDYIVNESKTIEIRLATPSLENLRKNDLIVFHDENDRYTLCQVEYAKRYATFEDLLAMEGTVNAIPFLEPGAESGCGLICEGVRMINDLPGYEERVKMLGALAIKINFIKFNSKNLPKIIPINDS